MIAAAVDLGSNSFICLIFKADPLGNITKLHDEVILTRLSEGVDQDKRLSLSALNRAEQAFQRFSDLFSQYGVKQVLGVATSAARDAKNKEEFLGLATKYGIPIRILSGEEEAQMTFEGVRDYFTEHTGVIVDIGGGSTEYILAQRGEIVLRTSLDMGAVRFTERYSTAHDFINREFKVREGIRSALLQSETLKRIKEQNALDFLMAVSGTPTNAVALVLGKFDDDQIEDFVLTQDHLKQLTESYSYKNLEQRLQEYPFIEAKRADVLPVGLAILEESMKFFGMDSYKVSTRGIRHGAAKSIINK